MSLCPGERSVSVINMPDIDTIYGEFEELEQEIEEISNQIKVMKQKQD